MFLDLIKSNDPWIHKFFVVEFLVNNRVEHGQTQGRIGGNVWMNPKVSQRSGLRPNRINDDNLDAPFSSLINDFVESVVRGIAAETIRIDRVGAPEKNQLRILIVGLRFSTKGRNKGQMPRNVAQIRSSGEIGRTINTHELKKSIPRLVSNRCPRIPN